MSFWDSINPGMAVVGVLVATCGGLIVWSRKQAARIHALEQEIKLESRHADEAMAKLVTQVVDSERQRQNYQTTAKAESEGYQKEVNRLHSKIKELEEDIAARDSNSSMCGSDRI